MDPKDTICFKISESIDRLNHALTGELDIVAMAKLLHEIREDATKMEVGLKIRKQIMQKHGLEKEYQILKGEKNAKNGVNKLPEQYQKREEKLDFEIIIKEKNEIVYQNKVHSAVLCMIEKIKSIDEYGEVSGKSQVLTLGHDLAVWFAFDQLKQAVEAKSIQIQSAIRYGVVSGEIKDPNYRKSLMEMVNK